MLRRLGPKLLIKNQNFAEGLSEMHPKFLPFKELLRFSAPTLEPFLLSLT
jgi:hypothetical protein